jgi:hypothetical protein
MAWFNCITAFRKNWSDTVREIVELILAGGALLLLTRDMRRAWLDKLRRPITLLVGAIVAALLIGAFGGRPYPDPLWLVLPGSILAWEVGRGWRRAPRCHRGERPAGSIRRRHGRRKVARDLPRHRGRRGGDRRGPALAVASAGAPTVASG